MRVITGKYKGRHFDIPRTFKARPTTDFAKENIFNVLGGYVDFDDATALDLFAGTGSISLEFLSRGCRLVVSVEADRNHVAFINQCMRTVQAGESSVVLKTDVLRFLRSAHQSFNIVFADPPYAMPELPTLPDLILSSGVVADGGLLIFEHGGKDDFSDHPHFIEHRSYGSVNFSLFR